MSEPNAAETARPQASAAAAPLAPPPRLRTIAALFARIGMVSFGGGLAGWYYREVVERRRWMRENDFLSGLALAQIMPGINATNLLIYVGHRLRGWRGAILAPVSLLVPPVLISIAVISVYEQVAHYDWLHRFLEGAAAAAVGLTLTIGFRAVRHSAKDIGLFAVFALTFAAIGVLRWPMVPVVLCVAPLGIAAAWRIRSRAEGGPDA